MSSSSTPSCPLSPLIRHGLDLATLLCRAQDKGGEMEVNIDKGIEGSNDVDISKAESVVMKLLEELEKSGAEQSATLVEESMHKVMAKIKDILQELIKVDPQHEKRYQKLAKKLDERRRFSRKTTSGRAAGDHSHRQQSSPSVYDQQEEAAVMLKYVELNDVEKECLLCYPLLPVDVLLEKRVITKWWLAMGLISPGPDGGKAEGDEILTKLLKMGFVDPLISDKYLSNMNSKFRTKLLLLDTPLMQFNQSDAFSIVFYMRLNKPQAVLNIGESTLDSKVFDFVSSKKGASVVHLGRWRQSHDYDRDHSQDNNGEVEEDYIVIEDYKTLDHALYQLGGQVRYLSLQGISGLVVLPKSICKLTNLLVLDLRACNNLETLPKRIGSLRKLLYLDLSECYLLNYIPKGITSLSQLVVLKGFIINPHVRHGNLYKACGFSGLEALKNLRKLTVRTRRMGFPTKEDLQTLYKLSFLTSLRIAWGKTRDQYSFDVFGGAGESDYDEGTSFPTTLEKLELQAVPAVTASRLLGIICRKEEDVKLKKLYIRGAFGEPDFHNICLPSVKEVRLRYLPQLNIDWAQFRVVFPNLDRVEIHDCSNLTNSFPLDDHRVVSLDDHRVVSLDDFKTLEIEG